MQQCNISIFDDYNFIWFKYAMILAILLHASTRIVNDETFPHFQIDFTSSLTPIKLMPYHTNCRHQVSIKNNGKTTLSLATCHIILSQNIVHV